MGCALRSFKEAKQGEGHYNLIFSECPPEKMSLRGASAPPFFFAYLKRLIATISK